MKERTFDVFFLGQLAGQYPNWNMAVRELDRLGDDYIATNPSRPRKGMVVMGKIVTPWDKERAKEQSTNIY
jgi:hypothetical protein